MTKLPLVCVVVLNWNGVDDTLRCLESLAKIDYPQFRVLVVDNGSTDDSRDRLRLFRPCYALDLLETGRNLGYAGGNNFGVKRALDLGAKWLLILNNDTTVSPDLLTQLTNAAERNPSAGVFCARVMYSEPSKIVSFDGARWNVRRARMERPGQDKPEHTLSREDHVTDYACGAALFFHADVTRKIGLLDERFFLVWEDADWCFRARAAGWQCIVVPKAKVWHKVGSSFGSEDSPLRTYFTVRNRLLWCKRHASSSAYLKVWFQGIRWLIPSVAISTGGDANLVKRWTRAIPHFVLAMMGQSEQLKYLAARRGVLDYIRGRFGDCPPAVREWSQKWAASKRATSKESDDRAGTFAG